MIKVSAEIKVSATATRIRDFYAFNDYNDGSNSLVYSEEGSRYFCFNSNTEGSVDFHRLSDLANSITRDDAEDANVNPDWSDSRVRSFVFYPS